MTDARALAIAEKVTYVIDPDNDYPRNYTGHIRAELKDGTIVEERQGQLRGGIREPGDLVAKAGANLTFAGRRPEASHDLLDFATALFVEDARFDARPLATLGA